MRPGLHAIILRTACQVSAQERADEGLASAEGIHDAGRGGRALAQAAVIRKAAQAAHGHHHDPRSAGVHGASLKLRINAPPVDGKANEAVLAFLAERLGVRRQAVRLASGATSRAKRVAVDGVDVDPARLLAPAKP